MYFHSLIPYIIDEFLKIDSSYWDLLTLKKYKLKTMTYTYPHDLSNSLFSCRWLPNANRFQCFYKQF